MQDNHSNEFDLRLRSMLEDAEVKPSRRVWKGVSARLDADSAPAAGLSMAWLKWAGMSLAAAAAIAAGGFFSGTRTSIPTINHNQEQAMLAQAVEAAGDVTGVTVPAAPAVPDAAEDQTAVRPERRSTAVRRSSGQPVERTEAPVQQDEVASVPADTPAQAAEPAPQKPAVTRRERTPRTVIPAIDPFAAEEPARSAFRPRVALYAQGAIGSNDPNGRPAAPGAWMAPGQESGFSELSSSTYGVPFTLGLGARIQLLPRFSVGTGLDYSLLTRSFTGSFEGESGSISHTLQYLGIPVNFFYDIVSSDRIKFYVYAGGEAEYCISNKYRLFANPDIIREYPVNRLQYSVGGGLGVEFRLSRRIGIYLDPGLNYYFPCNQPKSIRTDKPLLLNFDAGLRFNFR